MPPAGHRVEEGAHFEEKRCLYIVTEAGGDRGVGEEVGELVAAQRVGVEAVATAVGATVLVAVGGTGTRSAAGMGGAEGWV